MLTKLALLSLKDQGLGYVVANGHDREYFCAFRC